MVLKLTQMGGAMFSGAMAAWCFNTGSPVLGAVQAMCCAVNLIMFARKVDE